MKISESYHFKDVIEQFCRSFSCMSSLFAKFEKTPNGCQNPDAPLFWVTLNSKVWFVSIDTDENPLWSIFYEEWIKFVCIHLTQNFGPPLVKCSQTWGIGFYFKTFLFKSIENFKVCFLQLQKSFEMILISSMSCEVKILKIIYQSFA